MVPLLHTLRLYELSAKITSALQKLSENSPETWDWLLGRHLLLMEWKLLGSHMQISLYLTTQLLRVHSLFTPHFRTSGWSRVLVSSLHTGWAFLCGSVSLWCGFCLSTPKMCVRFSDDTTRWMWAWVVVSVSPAILTTCLGCTSPLTHEVR